MIKANAGDMLSSQDVSSAPKDAAAFRILDTSPEVLVVDDSDQIRGIAAQMLREAGYRVRTATNGYEAQQALAEGRPALIVTDLWMPVCNGWQLLEYCQTRWPLLPVILMSSDSLGSRPEIERWAAGFLPKPFTARELLSEVGWLVALRPQTQNKPAGLRASRPAG